MMPDLNFATLKDRLLDVDPDLRFMGLRDLIKYLTTLWKSYEPSKGQLPVSSRHLMTFLPTFLHLLDDLNSDVQGQAIQVFAAMTPYLATEDLLVLIDKLYGLIVSELTLSQATKAFTTTVPYMALKAVINQLVDLTSDPLNSRPTSIDTRPTPITPSAARSIVECLLPQLTSNATSIDSVELLFDVILNLGYIFDQVEISSLAKYLIAATFRESGIVSKRAIAAFESLCKLITTRDCLNDLVVLIDGSHGRRDPRTTTTIKCLLYSIIFQSPLGIDANLLQMLIDRFVTNLKMAAVDATAQIEEDADFDFDVLVEENLLREDSLGALSELLLSNNNLEDFRDVFFKVIRYFVAFDPIRTQCSEEKMDFDLDQSEIEFSDDENDDDGDENDGSWKLRAKSSRMVRAFYERWPATLDAIYADIYTRLPVSDQNESSSHEALVTMAFLLGSSHQFNELIFTYTKRLVLANLLDSPDPQILSIIASLSRFRDDEFIKALFLKISDAKNHTSTSLSFLDLYPRLLENCADYLTPPEIGYIAGAIIAALLEKSFHVIKQGLQLAIQLLDSPCNIELGDQEWLEITRGVTDKVDNFKAYSSEILALSVRLLGSMLSKKFELESSAFQSLVDCLAIESLAQEALRALIRVYGDNAAIHHMVDERLLDGLLQLILSSNDQIRYLALRVLSLVIQLDAEYDFTTMIGTLLDIFKFRDTPSACLVLEILRSIVQSTQGSIPLEENVWAALKDLLNSGEFAAGHDELRELVLVIAQNRPDLFESLSIALDQNIPSAVEVLAIVCVVNQLNNVVTRCETQLVEICDSGPTPCAAGETLFLVRFLGFVQSEIRLTSLHLGHLVQLLRRVRIPRESGGNPPNESSANDESISSAIVDSVGLLVRRDVDLYLPELTTIYSAQENAGIRYMLVLSFKRLLDSLDEDLLSKVWHQIWLCINTVEFASSSFPELRNSADVLCEIAIRSPELVSESAAFARENRLGLTSDAYSVAYTHAVLIKELTKRLDTSDESNALLRDLIEAIITWLGTNSIDIRQVLIGNLLTALNMKPFLILPMLKSVVIPIVLQQLTPEPQFKRVIPMGPYKYVVDEGIEIRKLSYEFLHSLLAVDSKLILQYEIPVMEIARKVSEHGLGDDQLDVLVLSTINLANIIDNHRSSFNELVAGDGGHVLSGIVENLSKQLSKKLSEKASLQDVDAHNERTRSIICLSKKIDSVVSKFNGNVGHNLGESRDKWASYMVFLNTDFQLSLNL